MNILTCIPIKPQINPELRRLCELRLAAMLHGNPEHRIAAKLDDRKIPSDPSDFTPWSRVTRARNMMLADIDLNDWDYLLWIDADVVEYPADMPTRLLRGNPGGVSAPFVMIEGTATFYDFAAFIMKGKSHIEPTNRWRLEGRNVQHYHPYFPEPMNGVVEMDCVGTVTMVPTWIYKQGVRYEDHPAFTDHFPICQACRLAGHPVTTDMDTIAYHADLPKYGEAWHILLFLLALQNLMPM